MRKILWLSLGISCLMSNIYADESMSVNVASPNTMANSIHPINKIVAFVNKDVITSNQVNGQIIQIMNNFKQSGTSPPSMEDVRAKVIEQLIMQQIQLDLANKSGIKVTDIEVNDAIDGMLKAQKIDLPKLKQVAAKDGLTYENFRQQIKNQLTIDKLKQREVDARIVVNDDDVNRVLNSEAYKNKIDYDLSDIIISIPEQASASVLEQKEELANRAYNDLQSGKSFSEMAIKYSNAPNALTGGALGWKSSATLPSVIVDQLQELQVGQFTKVIKLPVGFFIFKINDMKKHGIPQIVKQYHVRHILIKVNELTSDDEAHEKIIEIKNVLDEDMNNPTKLNQDFIAEAKRYSDDTSSINGGDIGWISKGDTVPAFEQAVITTPIGKVSDPIHTPFGWHILQVLGARDSNLTNDREKSEIRQEIHENKANMLYTQWLRSIREMSYVKMNDN